MNKKLRTVLSLVAVTAVATLGLAGCSGNSAGGDKPQIAYLSFA